MTLARAILTEPAVLILDDATSSVDAETEQAILGELFELRAGKTTLLVTHRTSTARLCDQILLLEGGRIEALGTHRELLRRSRTYERMADQEQLRAELGKIE